MPIKIDPWAVHNDYQLTVAKFAARIASASLNPDHGYTFLPRVENSLLISPIPLVEFSISDAA